jgi:hypothetical protein
MKTAGKSTIIVVMHDPACYKKFLVKRDAQSISSSAQVHFRHLAELPMQSGYSRQLFIEETRPICSIKVNQLNTLSNKKLLNFINRLTSGQQNTRGDFN